MVAVARGPRTVIAAALFRPTTACASSPACAALALALTPVFRTYLRAHQILAEYFDDKYTSVAQVAAVMAILKGELATDHPGWKLQGPDQGLGASWANYRPKCALAQATRSFWLPAVWH